MLIITGSLGLIGFSASEYFLKKRIPIIGIDNDLRSYFFGKIGSNSWKKKILKNNKNEIIFVDYFARKNDEYISNFNSVFQRLRKLNLSIKIDNIKYGNSICMNLKKLDKAGLKLLKKNKYSFVKKKSKL